MRIAQHITSDGSAIITPRIARWLEQNANMTADRRIRLRDTDPEAYVAFAALHLAACRSDCGTSQVAAQKNTTQLDMWLSTKQAAKALNVTDRCVRNWCTTGRLHAQLVGARWLINPSSIALHQIA
ncbi:helix-turn-helix domain-containing protein [Mycolicibacterium fluoranthenivorans]|uniref:helix-turn-helix domain-containing protein n=1 Tax=Mycolicibacterium fluoranthenivorans TaxID=258505 RepID=UPI000B803425|nr:helix-turn-helix domain-containing protein [Mycolicibacterium fluoranthenivorans]